MNCFRIINDKDFGIEPKELKNPITRVGARGIVVRKDGEIAIFNKEKENVFKLPGGGVEKGETPEKAFLRECLEETGCEVKITKNLGTIEEHKNSTNFKQISHVFVGEVVKDLGKLNITEKEREEGSKILWETPEKALKLIRNCFDTIKDSPYDKYENVYASKFIVLRDFYILDKYINENK